MIRKSFTVLAKTSYLLLSGIALYLLAVAILPYIPVNTSTPKQDDITLYVMSNGVHTDIVCPIYTENLNWSEWVPFENTKSQRSDFTHVAFGWGDKGFYLNTPTWADLKFSTAFNAAFWLGEAAMHVTFYPTPKEDLHCRKLTLSREHYEKLTRYIKDSFTLENGLPILIPTDQVYGRQDAFYEARGSYNLFFTCNTWTNTALKQSHQKAAFWTATDWGILHHYPLSDSDK